MHERAVSVNLDPQIEAECIHDLSQHCSELTAKSDVRHHTTHLYSPKYVNMVYVKICGNKKKKKAT